MHDVSKCSLQAIELSQSLSKLCTQTGRLSSSRTIQSAILACSSLTPVSRVSCFFFLFIFFLAVNECLTGLHRCSPHANCSDQRHGYHCACTLGFHGNGHVCRDINECFDPGDYPCRPIFRRHLPEHARFFPVSVRERFYVETPPLLDAKTSPTTATRSITTVGQRPGCGAKTPTTWTNTAVSVSGHS